MPTTLCANPKPSPDTNRPPAVCRWQIGETPRTQSRGHPKRPGHHCQCQVGLLPIPCQRQLVLQALELFSACVSDIPPWCTKVNRSTTMQWNPISSLVQLVHSLLVSSYVLVVVVCWWWRRGGVWREGCHWLHIHVPPSLVATILHHPGHQIILLLHQTILLHRTTVHHPESPSHQRGSH